MAGGGGDGMPDRRGARDGLVASLLHGLAILDMFERDRPVIGLADIARQLDVHRSNASRLAATLASAGYLESAGEPGRYRLAGKVAALGELAAVGTELRRAALPGLRGLVAELGETGHLAVLEGNEAVTVDVVDGWHSVRMHSWVGKRSPAHCSSMGKALLAGLPPAALAEAYPGTRLEARTPRTITGRRELERCLADVRSRGYASDLEELEAGLCCVAAPLFGRAGDVVAAISISGPVSRIHETTVPAIGEYLRRTGWQVSVRLGAPSRVPGWPAPEPLPPGAPGAGGSTGTPDADDPVAAEHEPHGAPVPVSPGAGPRSR
jgi:DNA-binding IclR family transcriptional regulator